MKNRGQFFGALLGGTILAPSFHFYPYAPNMVPFFDSQPACLSLDLTSQSIDQAGLQASLSMD